MLIVKKAMFLVSAVLFITGCVGKYGPRQEMTGGYLDKKIEDRIYYIEYEAAFLDLGSSVIKDIHKRAVELCGSEDYEDNAKYISGAGVHKAAGLFYCNTGYLDTRLQVPDENYSEIISLDKREFEYIEKSPLFALLVDRKFKKLDKELERIYSEYRGSKISERELKNILNTFSRNSRVLKNAIDDWVKHTPESAFPYYSRALYNHTVSWVERGGGLWSSLTAGMKTRFNKYNKLAKEDVNQAIKIDGKISIFHALSINIDTNKSQAKESYLLANKVVPESYLVSKAYMKKLLPRWGGSVAEMEAFAKSKQSMSKSNSELKKLLMFVRIEEADQHRLNKKPAKALEIYDDILSKLAIEEVLVQRGFVLANMQRYQESIAAFKMAMRFSPYNEYPHEGLMYVYIRINNIVDALRHASFLVAMNENSSNYLYARANLYYASRRYRDALRDYKGVLRLEPDSLLYKHKIKLTEFQIKVRQGKMIKEVPASI